MFSMSTFVEKVSLELVIKFKYFVMQYKICITNINVVAGFSLAESTVSPAIINLQPRIFASFLIGCIMAFI